MRSALPICSSRRATLLWCRCSRSALDPVNEAAVHEGVERLMAGRTVVLVAHRLRTVERADRVAFLDGGRIVADGSHDELLRGGGRYADLWAPSGVSPTEGVRARP